LFIYQNEFAQEYGSRINESKLIWILEELEMIQVFKKIVKELI